MEITITLWVNFLLSFWKDTSLPLGTPLPPPQPPHPLIHLLISHYLLGIETMDRNKNKEK